MMITPDKARQVAAVPHLCYQPSMKTCLRSSVSRARPRSSQHVVACTSPSAAVRQKAGSLHPLIPRPNEFTWGWLPASLLLILPNFNNFGNGSKRLAVYAKIDTGITFRWHISLVLACSSLCPLCEWHDLVLLCKHVCGCVVLLCQAGQRPGQSSAGLFCNDSCTCYCWHHGG